MEDSQPDTTFWTTRCVSGRQEKISMQVKTLRFPLRQLTMTAGYYDAVL